MSEWPGGWEGRFENRTIEVQSTHGQSWERENTGRSWNGAVTNGKIKAAMGWGSTGAPQEKGEGVWGGRTLLFLQHLWNPVRPSQAIDHLTPMLQRSQTHPGLQQTGASGSHCFCSAAAVICVQLTCFSFSKCYLFRGYLPCRFACIVF